MKTSKSTKKGKSKRKAAQSLKPLREQLKILTDRANKMVYELEKSGKESRALREAQRTFRRLRSRKGASTLFTSDLKDRRQINREFARVQAFLNDYTSTVAGANNFTSEVNDFNETFRARMHNGELNEAILGDVFDLYHRIVEASGGWERAVGIFQGKESLIGFGSEVLINNIYDMVDNGMDYADIISVALQMINDAHEDYERMASQAVGNYDYGVIFDDAETTARRRYFENKFMRRKEGYGRGVDVWK